MRILWFFDARYPSLRLNLTLVCCSFKPSIVNAKFALKTLNNKHQLRSNAEGCGYLTRQTQQVLVLWRLVALSCSAFHFWFQRWVRELTDAPWYLCFIWSLQYPVNITRFRKTVKTAVSFVVSACLSVRPSAWKSLVTTGRIWCDFCIWGFFENRWRDFNFDSVWLEWRVYADTAYHPWQHESSECKKFVHSTHSMYCLSCRRKMQR